MNLERAMTAFFGDRQIGAGPVKDLLISVKATLDAASASGDGETGQILIFDDLTGTQVDFDLRGSSADILVALANHPYFQTDSPERGTRGKGTVGRPKLGVTSREVTLLPRHWRWLEVQQSGASATLRRLVEGAMKSTSSDEKERAARDRAAKVMWCLAGNLPGFEEASRFLYRGDQNGFEQIIREWPEGIREYLLRLLKGERT